MVGQAQFNEEQFNPTVLVELPPEALEGAGTPQSITQVTPDRFILLPLPNDTEHLIRMWLALKPKRTAVGMEEVAFQELEDAIMHGALEVLFALPNTTWHDKEMVSYHAKKFLYATTERRARANLGNARGALVAHNPYSVW